MLDLMSNKILLNMEVNSNNKIINKMIFKTYNI